MKALGRFARLSVLVMGIVAVSLTSYADGVTISGGGRDTTGDYIANGIATRVSRLVDGMEMKVVYADGGDFSVIPASGFTGEGGAPRVVSYLYTTAAKEAAGETAAKESEAVFLVAVDKVPADTVHKVLTIIFSEDGLAYLAKVASVTAPLNIKDGLKGVTTLIHPGAEKFWREHSLAIGSGLVPAASNTAPSKE